MDSKKPVFDADAAEEYFTDLAVFYKNTANDIFKRDNEGRHASEHIWSAEYQKYLGMQIAMREVLEYFLKFELQQPNAPLSLDELREMDGEPVYIVYGEWKDWRIPDFIDIGAYKGFIRFTDKSAEPIAEYGKNWIAYRRKPEEGTT